MAPTLALAASKDLDNVGPTVLTDDPGWLESFGGIRRTICVDIHA